MASTITERQKINTLSAVKVPCKAATTANITLSGEQTIDGVACVTNDRVLVKNQTTASENGIYVVNTSGWERARDWDGSYDVKKGTFVYVTNGGNSGFWYVTTDDPIVPGTTSVSIAQASSQLLTFSAFMQTLFDDADAAEFLTTLGVSAYIQTLLDDANAAAARTTLGAAADVDVVHDTGDETIAGIKTFSSAPVMSAGATIGTAVIDSTGVHTAGTVPLARMQRTEVDSSTTTADLGTVNAGDRILITATSSLTAGGAGGRAYLSVAKSSGTATIEFGDTETSLRSSTITPDAATTFYATASGICKVTGAGTLVLSIDWSSAGLAGGSSFGTRSSNFIVLNNG